MQISGGTVRIADLAGPNMNIFDLTATGVHFVGPAVLYIGQNTRLVSNSIDGGGGGAEAVFWEVDPAREIIVGAIGVAESSFINCTFSGIGFAMYRENANKFFLGMFNAETPGS